MSFHPCPAKLFFGLPTSDPQSFLLALAIVLGAAARPRKHVLEQQQYTTYSEDLLVGRKSYKEACSQRYN